MKRATLRAWKCRIGLHRWDGPLRDWPYCKDCGARCEHRWDRIVIRPGAHFYSK